MKNYSYMTQGTCARQITFSLEDGKLHDVHFVGGCPGNTLLSASCWKIPMPPGP